MFLLAVATMQRRWLGNSCWRTTEADREAPQHFVLCNLASPCRHGTGSFARRWRRYCAALFYAQGDLDYSDSSKRYDAGLHILQGESFRTSFADTNGCNGKDA